MKMTFAKLLIPFFTIIALMFLPLLFLPENKSLGMVITIEEENKFQLEKAKTIPEKQIKAENKSDVLFSKIDINKDVYYVYKSTTTVPTQTRYLEDGEVKKEKSIKVIDRGMLGASVALTEDITKRTHSALHFPHGDGETTTAEIYSGSAFFYDDPEWYFIEYASTTIDAYNDQMDTNYSATSTSYWLNPFIVGTAIADTLTAYSAPDDGYIQSKPASGVGWDTAHDATTGTALVNTVWWGQINSQYLSGPDRYNIEKLFFFFDTSSLGADATISSTSLNFKPDYTIAENDGYDYATVLEATPASDSALSTSDFDQCGDSTDNPTKGSNDIDISSGITINVYNTWTLNATGRGWIDKTGTTTLCFREGHDQEDNTPTAATNMRGYMYEEAGTSNDPYLSITYTTEAAAVAPKRRASFIIFN